MPNAANPTGEPLVTLRHLHVVERLIFLKGHCPCCNTPARRRIVDFGLPLDTPLHEVRWPWECKSSTGAAVDTWEPDLTRRRQKKLTVSEVLKEGYTRLEAWCGDLACHHRKILRITDLPVKPSTRLDDLEVRLRCSKCGGFDIGIAPDSTSRPKHESMPDLTWRMRR